MPATDGLFIFARVGRDVDSVEQAAELMNKLKRQGLAVSPGHIYNGTENGFG